MRLDVGDGVRLDLGHQLRGADDLRLPVDARRREADLHRRIVVHRRPQQDRADLVAVGERVRQPLEDDDAHAVAGHGPARLGVEGPAVAVARDDATLVVVTGLGWGDHSGAARQGHVALAPQQRLGGQMDRDQRRRARSLDGDGGSAQSELVGDPACEEVDPGRHPELEVGHRRQALALREKPSQVTGLGAPPVDPDRPRVGAGVAARVLQRLPGALQEEALLRIQDERLGGRASEERGVEAVGVLDHAGGGDVVHGLVGWEDRQRLDAADQVRPVFVEVRRAGEPRRHPDDRDVLASVELRISHCTSSITPAGGREVSTSPSSSSGRPSRSQLTATPP